MCFSASSSFTASALLALAGAAMLSRTKSSNEYMLASIPLLFAAQQFAEGVVWLSLTQPQFQHMNSYGIYGFMLFAFIVWPLWIPTSIAYYFEKLPQARRLTPFVWIGRGVSLLSVLLLFSKDVVATIHGHHIYYQIDTPLALSITGTIAYLIATIPPFFFIISPRLNLTGAMLALSYGVSIWFYNTVAISVWCFFAALISILIFLII